MEISHEEFITILKEKDKYEKIKEKDKYEKMKDNLRSENEKYEIMRLSLFKIIEPFTSSKKFIFFLCMYKMDSFALFTANAWRKNDVEVIEYGGKIWINQGHLQEKLDIANIADRTQYYSDEF